MPFRSVFYTVLKIHHQNTTIVNCWKYFRMTQACPQRGNEKYWMGVRFWILGNPEPGACRWAITIIKRGLGSRNELNWKWFFSFLCWYVSTVPEIALLLLLGSGFRFPVEGYRVIELCHPQFERLCLMGTELI